MILPYDAHDHPAPKRPKPVGSKPQAMTKREAMRFLNDCRTDFQVLATQLVTYGTKLVHHAYERLYPDGEPLADHPVKLAFDLEEAQLHVLIVDDKLWPMSIEVEVVFRRALKQLEQLGSGDLITRISAARAQAEALLGKPVSETMFANASERVLQMGAAIQHLTAGAVFNGELCRRKWSEVAESIPAIDLEALADAVVHKEQPAPFGALNVTLTPDGARASVAVWLIPITCDDGEIRIGLGLAPFTDRSPDFNITDRPYAGPLPLPCDPEEWGASLLDALHSLRRHLWRSSVERQKKAEGGS
tara:strand:- start:186 stop:1094 length:909 start_codon:yes stop_codon:yes gene_type:complete